MVEHLFKLPLPHVRVNVDICSAYFAMMLVSVLLAMAIARFQVAGAGMLMTSEIVSSPSNEEYGSSHDLLWESREVLAGAGFCEKSDVYSFGIVLWEIMREDGSLPYAGVSSKEVRWQQAEAIQLFVDNRAQMIPNDQGRLPEPVMYDFLDRNSLLVDSIVKMFQDFSGIL